MCLVCSACASSADSAPPATASATATVETGQVLDEQTPTALVTLAPTPTPEADGNDSVAILEFEVVSDSLVPIRSSGGNIASSPAELRLAWDAAGLEGDPPTLDFASHSAIVLVVGAGPECPNVVVAIRHVEGSIDVDTDPQNAEGDFCDALVLAMQAIVIRIPSLDEPACCDLALRGIELPSLLTDT